MASAENGVQGDETMKLGPCWSAGCGYGNRYDESGSLLPSCFGAALVAENERLRWALEEIIQASTPGSPPWAVIPDDLIEKARKALGDQ